MITWCNVKFTHRLRWQSTISYPVQPSNVCRTFGDAGVRLSTLFILRHCLPVVGRLTLMEQYDTVLLGRQRTDVYPQETVNGPHVTYVPRQARNKLPEYLAGRLLFIIGDG